MWVSVFANVFMFLRVLGMQLSVCLDLFNFVRKCMD